MECYVCYTTCEMTVLTLALSCVYMPLSYILYVHVSIDIVVVAVAVAPIADAAAAATTVAVAAIFLSISQDDDIMKVLNAQSSSDARALTNFSYYFVPLPWLRNAWNVLHLPNLSSSSQDDPHWRQNIGRIECTPLLEVSSEDGHNKLRSGLKHGKDFVLLGDNAWLLLGRKFGYDVAHSFPVVFHASDDSRLAVQVVHASKDEETQFIPIPSSGRFPYDSYIQGELMTQFYVPLAAVEFGKQESDALEQEKHLTHFYGPMATTGFGKKEDSPPANDELIGRYFGSVSASEYGKRQAADEDDQKVQSHPGNVSDDETADAAADPDDLVSIEYRYITLLSTRLRC
jgi:hypothetical protein